MAIYAAKSGRLTPTEKANMLAALERFSVTHFAHLMKLVAAEHRLAMSAVALYEWQRGPRTPAELDIQTALVPEPSVWAFGAAEATVAATLNPRDFAAVPGLRLI